VKWSILKEEWLLEEETWLSFEEDIFGLKWKWKEKSLGKSPPYIALVKILGYMDESYISPSLEKTLKLAF
jgi:mevalonate pyrophosphate decarboxylase